MQTAYSTAHANWVAKFCELLEDMVIAALRAGNEIQNVLFNTVQDLPVTLVNIKIKAEKDAFINEKKKQVGWNLKEKNKSNDKQWKLIFHI